MYRLTAPTDDPRALGEGLELLRDWAGAIAFDAPSVEAARQEILREDRTWGSRRLDWSWSRTATPAELRRFYAAIYQPQHMAVIAIGDLDPRSTLAAITARFGDLVGSPAPVATAALAPAIEVHASGSGPALISITDALDRGPPATRADYRRSILAWLEFAMVSARLDARAADPAGPFAFVGADTLERGLSPSQFRRWAGVRDDGHGDRLDEAITALFRELAAVEQRGFTAAELAAALAAMRTAREARATYLRDATPDVIAAEAATQFFARAEIGYWPFDPEAERAALAQVTLAELDRDAMAWRADKHRAIAIDVAGPPGSAPPTTAHVQALIQAAGAMP